uniref:Isoprenylcysteine carboxyl methyltransferase n=1 Tax=uncultured Planctomycetota bacterium TaxID=120965 RepID=H5SCT0_9BACT|nr:hypothetical protein HGMM_F11G08C03 [uncultured Planctomycetota bacterium]
MYSWIVLMAGLLTWYGFASRMRRSFRYADRWPPAKTILVLSGWLCTLTQLAILAWHLPITLAATVGALVLYGLANLLFWSALRTHGRDKPAFVFTEARPNSFRCTGPYRYIRHPLYTAYLLAWLAPPVATGQWWLFALTAWMALLYTLAAWQEERAFARSPFAADYQRYRSYTGMFWPRPKTLLTNLVTWFVDKRYAPRPASDAPGTCCLGPTMSTNQEQNCEPSRHHDAA